MSPFHDLVSRFGPEVGVVLRSSLGRLVVAAGLGGIIGDGQLPRPGFEQIIEAYYSYALNSSTRLTFDYQFLNNPAYNTDRGPVNTFAARFHAQF